MPDAHDFGEFAISKTPGEDGAYAVATKKGAEYKIEFSGSGDGDPDYVATWKCSCPGYSYRGVCKHIRAFLDNGISQSEGEV